MTPEERSLIDGLFERMREVQGAPRDAEAEALIRQRVAEMPYAPYALAQSVLVQEHALQQAYARIEELEAEANAMQAELDARPAAQAPQNGGFLGGLLGGRSSVPSAGARTVPPVSQARSDAWGNARNDAPMGVPPGYGAGAQRAPYGGAPQQDPYGQGAGQPYGQASGPWGAQPARGGFGGGGGFLQGALATAAGVAGGALLFDGIKNLMGGGEGPVAQHAAAELPKAPAADTAGSGNLGADAQQALGGAPGTDQAPIDQAFWDDPADDGDFDDGGDWGMDDDGSWA